MATLLTREQAIRKGKRLRRLTALRQRCHSLVTGHRNTALRREVFVETEYGKVRTLWYGFENPAPAPIFFDLHGGGFILGSADMDQAFNLELSRRVGCKIISIDYAKAPEFPYPAAVNQVYAVVKHVFERAATYAVEREKMAIGGHSSGGNLSTVTCMQAQKAGQFQFACQVLDYPPLDLATSPFAKPQPKGCIPPAMASVFDACYIEPTQARDPHVSPVYATLDDLRGLPPALLLLAGRDSLHDEGMKYCDMLKTAGVVVECYAYPDALHGFTLEPSNDGADAREKMVVFLERYLANPAGGTALPG